MKNTLRFIMLMTAIVSLNSLMAQTRYLDEVFTDSELSITNNVTFATNINFLTSSFSPTAQLVTDIGTLSALANAGSPYPAPYYNPADASTQLKVSDLKMDIYRPSDLADTETARPVIVYLHTGNFLPPPINGSMMGTKGDSLAVDLCKSWARRGYVAVSLDYRLGWNPIAPDVQTRRGTLLNAVYRAIQDTKMGVRFLKDDATAANSYGINPDKIALFGEGSGGYMSVAYVTLDNPSAELFLEKFRPNPFDASVSYIDTLQVGLPNGFGYSNSVNLYRDTLTSADVQMSINAGGALADESWLEAGDAPMVSFHAIRDDFAPFTFGTVIVPTTQEEVVDVHGSNFFIQKANDLGNNAVFAGLPDGDIYTDRARSLYGSSWGASNGGTETVNAAPEGLFPVVQPLRPFLTNISSPWQWWNPTSPLSLYELAPGFTTHMAQIGSNPNMSEAQSIAFQDTINGYMLPRLSCALELPGNPCMAVDPCDLNAPDLVGTPIICDNLESYAAGAIGPQADHWGVWAGGAEGVVTSEQAFSGTQSMLVEEGGAVDALLLLGDQTSGEFGLIWKCYIPSQKTGYYNIQNDEVPGLQWNMNVFFNQGNIAPGTGVVTNGTNVEVATFSYPMDQWFTVLHRIDLDADVLELIIDGETVMTDYPYPDNIGSIDFYSIDANNRYYIDDIAYGGDLTITVDERDVLVYSVFPNPSSGDMTIRSEKKMDAVMVYDMLGSMVMNVPANRSMLTQIDLSSLKPGIYLLGVQIEGRTYNQRIIKE